MSGQESSNQKKTIHKVDRRRFDSNGNERGNEPDGAGVEVPLQQKPAATETDSFKSRQFEEPAQFAKLTGAQVDSVEMDELVEEVPEDFEGEGSSAPQDDVTFTSFIMSLATQTMVQLGEMQPPPGMEIPLDVESAKQSIEIIAMLQKKTNGNLSTEESRFLVDVLHTLRTSYVRRSA